MTTDDNGAKVKHMPLTIMVPVKHYRCSNADINTGLDMEGTFKELSEELHDEIIMECKLIIYVNGHMLIQILCLPTHLEELVVGYLLTEGIIASYDDIDSLYIDMGAGRADVRLSVEVLGEESTAAKIDMIDNTGRETIAAERAGAEMTKLMMTTDSGDEANIFGVAGTPGIFIRHPLRPVAAAAYNCENVLENANLLLMQSELFRKTGNVHSVMLCREKDLLCFREDVGRFGAFDKCVGFAVMRGWTLKDMCMYTTGRVPSSLVRKAVRAGVPMLISRSAPTDKALELAALYGVTIVGFARGDRMTLYMEKGK